MTRAKDGNGVTLLDKTTFYRWAQDTYQLDGGEQYVLSVIVFDLLGLEDGKPHNAWTTRGVLATACHMRKRGVQRVLDRLDELGLVKHFGVAGRGGRTMLHVPGVVDAAKLLKRRQLRDGTKDEPEPNGHDASAETQSKRCPPGPLKNVEKVSSRTAKRCPPGPLNPLNESLEGSESLERVSGGAANRHPGEPPALNLEEGEEGAFGREGRTLTRPRQRLRDRVVGMATKLGLQDRGARFLRFATEVTVGDWLRLQRERRDQRLVQAIWQALVDEYGLDAEEAGRLLANKAEPEPEPTPEPEPPAPAAKPPSPPASSPSPSPPRPPAWRARAGGNMAAALRGPEHKPEPRKPFACSDSDMRASVERLKGYPS